MRRALLALTGIAISVAAIGLLVLTVDLGGTLRVLGGAAWLPLAGALVGISAQVAVRSLRWQLLLPRSQTGARVRLGRLIPVLLVGYLGNSLLPARLGELVRAYLVSVREKVPLGSALGSVLLERVIDLSNLAAIAFAAAMVAAAPGWIVQGTALAALVGLAGLVLLISGALAAVGRFVPEGRARELVHTFAQSAGRQPRPTLVAAVGISTVAWLLDATTFFLAGSSLSLGLSFPAALLIGAVTVLGTAIPSAPGYVGTFELAAVAAGTALGLGADRALALALLVHAITSIPVVLAGATSLTGMSLSLRGLAREAEAAAGSSAGPEPSA